MSDIQHYTVFYTDTAITDMDEKADYITFQFQDPGLAERWYVRLRDEIQSKLTTFPFKYPLYDVQPWRERGVRLFTTRNDVILYTVDLNNAAVYVWAVCTKGRDLSTHLSESEHK